MNLVEQWLNSQQKNFIVGKTLYARFGHDAKLKLLFAEGENRTTQQRLIQAMQALMHPVASIGAVAQLPVSTKDPSQKEDAITKALDAEWKPLYKRMYMLRNDMYAKWGSGNSEEARAACKDACGEILELEQQCIVIWAKRDHYLQHGALPAAKEKETDIPTAPVDLAKFIENCARQIRRYRETAKSNAKHAAAREKYKSLYKEATGTEYAEKTEGDEKN